MHCTLSSMSHMRICQDQTFTLILIYFPSVLVPIFAGFESHVVSSYKQRFYTPASNNYYLMEDYGLSVMGKNTIWFEVQACSNVHILLMNNMDDFDENVREIIIGEEDNSQSLIRKRHQGVRLAFVTHRPLDCNKLKKFWISWIDNTVKVGIVTTVELVSFISFVDEDLPPIKFFSISTRNGSTGHWVFDSSDFVNECCSYEAADCQDILDLKIIDSGVYSVTPTGSHTSFDVYCDMNTDSGGWLVFQRRLDGSENFYRNWTDYKTGFGNLLHEFWLGNDHLYSVVSQGMYTLRIELEDMAGNKRFANYETFQIGGPAENYKLTVGGYSGDAGDSFTFQNGAAFSTYDQDNDDASTDHCARHYEGAWWYTACHISNLNGRYLNGSQTSYANGVNWNTWKGFEYSLKATEMKIRRK